MIPEVANHLISSGGKRLRPMLTIAGARLCGYAGEGHLKLAASVEFMHTATLLHDDVVDDSDMRRGKPAARTLWGNEASVLVGDFLLGQAFKMMVEVGSLPCLDVLSTAAAVIAEGEVMQLAAAKNLSTSRRTSIWRSSAPRRPRLCGAACEVGPLLGACARSNPSAPAAALVGIESRHRLPADGRRARLRRHDGEARQERRRRFPRGKITLPVVLSYRRGDAAERAFWRDAMEQGVTDDAALEKAIGLHRRHRSLEDTVERARHYGAIAKDALEISRPRRCAMR